jgi:hypothetical protein
MKAAIVSYAIILNAPTTDGIIVLQKQVCETEHHDSLAGFTLRSLVLLPGDNCLKETTQCKMVKTDPTRSDALKFTIL